MIGEIAEILLRVLGGVWDVQRSICNTKSPWLKKTLMVIFDLAIKNMGGYMGVSTKVASPLCLPHGFKGVFISGGAIVGKNCVIFQNVTIGSNPLPNSKTCGSPTIGDNCYIGAGAAIIGAIRIGNNCRIGANCTIFKDLPDNSIAVVQEPKIFTKNNLINKYYKWSIDGPLFFDNGEWYLEECRATKKLLKGKL